MTSEPSGSSPLTWNTQLPDLTNAPVTSDEVASGQVPDRRDGAVYVLDDEIRLAVDVALATQRPLLLRGEPGSGKSSLAAFIARNMNSRYYEHVVTARTQARDLIYTFDAVRKLADASVPGAGAERLRDANYVEPGPIWWALDPDSAQRRGVLPDEQAPSRAAVDPGLDHNAGRRRDHAVLLIDEIDKADPDLPNGLLVPLGSREFMVSETGATITAPQPSGDQKPPGLLVVITTNEERILPPAFLRRCVIHELSVPGPTELAEIGRLHLERDGVEIDDGVTALLDRLASRLASLRTQTTAGARPPSTAEYLDAARAATSLGITVDGPRWEQIERLVLAKGGQTRPGRP